MSYLEVLPLAEVKTYLRIDDTQNETDYEIISMIKAAFRHIEKTTNIHVIQKEKDYAVTNGCVDVYDYPINEVLTDNIKNTKKRNNYTSFFAGFNEELVTLNIGYTDAALIDTDIIELAKVIVKVMYYEQESNKSFNELLPKWAYNFLMTNRRFIL